MSSGYVNPIYTNMSGENVANVLNNVVKMRMKRLTATRGENDELTFALVIEPTDEFSKRVDNITSREIDRIRFDNPSVRIGNVERKSVRRLCRKIVRMTTARLVSFVLDGDSDGIDAEIVDSASKDVADDMIDELLIGLDSGRSFSVLCKELHDVAARDIWATDY